MTEILHVATETSNGFHHKHVKEKNSNFPQNNYGIN